MKQKSEILAELEKLGFPDEEVVLTLETFFSNKDFLNSDNAFGAIGVNIYPNQPSPEVFYNTLKLLIETKKAEQVFVRLADASEPVEWFYSDAVYVVTDISLEEIIQLTEPISPDEVIEGWMYQFPVNLDATYINKNVYSLWWD